MNASTRTAARTLSVAVRAMLMFTLLVGVLYTLVITGVAQLAFPAQANGSLVRDGDDTVVGSSLIGQSFTDAEGAPLPEYFQSRPSAAGDGYDGGGSSGSNLGPENETLIDQVRQRRADIAAFEGVDPAAIPADALTTSSSGLDPHISPEYALVQVERVAAARGVSADEIRAILARHTTGRTLGFLGEPTVNVVELNLALDEAED